MTGAAGTGRFQMLAGLSRRGRHVACWRYGTEKLLRILGCSMSRRARHVRRGRRDPGADSEAGAPGWTRTNLNRSCRPCRRLRDSDVAAVVKLERCAGPQAVTKLKRCTRFRVARPRAAACRPRIGSRVSGTDSEVQTVDRSNCGNGQIVKKCLIPLSEQAIAPPRGSPFLPSSLPPPFLPPSSSPSLSPLFLSSRGAPQPGREE